MFYLYNWENELTLVLSWLSFIGDPCFGCLYDFPIMLLWIVKMNLITTFGCSKKYCKNGGTVQIHSDKDYEST